MRLWRDEQPTSDKPATQSEYETVGYVFSGPAELVTGNRAVRLGPGESY